MFYTFPDSQMESDCVQYNTQYTVVDGKIISRVERDLSHGKPTKLYVSSCVVPLCVHSQWRSQT